MKKLENRIAVVTGGNSGIGFATAKLFAAEGAKVAITGRNQQTINEAVKEIGASALGLVSDAADISIITSAYEKITNNFGGKIDVLVVNAGVFIGAPLADYTEEQYDQTMDINLKGVFFAVQRALPFLNDGASVILTSTALNEKGLGIAAAYSASKAAVRSLARSFSGELLSRNIRVNVLSPGAIDTPIYARGGGSKEEVDGSKAYFAAAAPAKRLGTVEEIAAGFLYLASDDSRYMIGGELLLDGGVKTL